MVVYIGNERNSRDSSNMRFRAVLGAAFDDLTKRMKQQL